MNNYQLHTINIDTKVKKFIKRNFHLILVSMYSINTYTNISKINEQKLVNYLHYTNYKISYTYLQDKPFIQNHYQIITIIHIIINILVQKNLQKQVRFILKEMLDNHSSYSTITQNYLKRFHYNYIKNTNSYIIGYKLYKNKTLIKILSIISLFVISKTHNRNGITYLLLYLVYFNI